MKATTKQRLVKSETTFFVCCSYSVLLSVELSETVVVISSYECV
jgi:hypothetical protein